MILSKCLFEKGVLFQHKMQFKHWLLSGFERMKDAINSLSFPKKASKQTYFGIRPFLPLSVIGPYIYWHQLRSSIIRVILTIVLCIATCSKFANADQGRGLYLMIFQFWPIFVIIITCILQSFCWTQQEKQHWNGQGTHMALMLRLQA